jgi:hypothetical protein
MLVIVRLEGLGKIEQKTVTLSGLEPVTFQLVALQITNSDLDGNNIKPISEM